MSEMTEQVCGTWRLASAPAITWTYNADGTGSGAGPGGRSTPIRWRLEGDMMTFRDASGQSFPGLPTESNPDQQQIVSVDDDTMVILPWDEEGPMVEMTLQRVT